MLDFFKNLDSDFQDFLFSEGKYAPPKTFDATGRNTAVCHTINGEHVGDPVDDATEVIVLDGDTYVRADVLRGPEWAATMKRFMQHLSEALQAHQRADSPSASTHTSI